MKRSLAMMALPVLALAAASQPQASVLDGLWQSPKDEDGSYLHVRLGPCGEAPEARCGTVTGAFDGARPEAVGHRVVRVEPQPDGSWEGEIVQPLEGDVYDSEIRPAGEDVLQVDGCIIGGLICRSQRWTRVE